LLKSKSHKCFLLEILAVNESVLGLVFPPASLSVVELQEHVALVLVVFCVKIDVVCPAELLVVKSLDEVLMNKLDYLLGEKEPDALDID